MDYSNGGERQVATELSGIREDHRKRYEFVISKLERPCRVVDAGCGVGYGSHMLAEAGCEVLAFDRDPAAIEFAERFWKHENVGYSSQDIYEVQSNERGDVAVCFEVLEHLVDPGLALRNLHGMADRLFASVPNEDDFPYRGYRHHVRHYTHTKFAGLLANNGWKPVAWYGQEDAHSGVESGPEGRTIIAICERDDEFEYAGDQEPLTPEKVLGGPVPESVAIVAMGRSRWDFINDTIQSWGKPQADEIWAINAMGGLLQWDRLFHMDDVKVQEARVRNGNTKLQAMLDWMKRANRPIYTSRAYPDYPALVEYPLEMVLQRTGHPYMNSTVAYAVALAIAVGVKRIALYGADFSYPESHKREKGRGCVEFWMGVAAARGIELTVPGSSTLLDADRPITERLYGYDTEWLSVQNVAGRIKVARVERLPDDIPTAEDIEIRYSHDPRKERRATKQQE